MPLAPMPGMYPILVIDEGRGVWSGTTPRPKGEGLPALCLPHSAITRESLDVKKRNAIINPFGFAKKIAFVGIYYSDLEKR